MRTKIHGAWSGRLKRSPDVYKLRLLLICDVRVDPKLPFSGVRYQEGLVGPEDRNHLAALLVSKASVSALTDEGGNVNGRLRSWLEFSALCQFLVDGEKGADLVVNYKGNGVVIVPRVVALQVGPLGRVV